MSGRAWSTAVGIIGYGEASLRGQLLESRAREPYLHPSSSERVTTPGGPSPPGVVARTGPGALSGPVSGADGHPGMLARSHPGHRPTRNANDTSGVTGAQTNTPAEGRHRPARPGCLRYGPAHPRAALERTLTGRQPLRRG